MVAVLKNALQTEECEYLTTENAVSAAGGVGQVPPGEIDLAGGGVDQGDGFVTAVDPGGVGQRGQDDHVAGGVRARRSAGRVS